MKTTRLVFLLAALTALLTRGTAQVPTLEVQDARALPEEIVIFPWDHLTTTSQLAAAYDCGFNVAGFCSPDLLDDVHKLGMKCFVTDPLIMIRGGETLADAEITSRVQAITARTATHPAVYGYHLLDEPKPDLFPVIQKWVAAFHERAPDRVAYTNLLPNYSKRPGPGGPFKDYLTSFVQQVHPKAYSYDHYSLFEGGGVREAYFPNLETARKVSLRTGVPFWQVLLGNSHFHYAEPTAAGFRFQVYSSLAYGARGLGWFTFTARERGNYRCTALDAYGRRTPTFDLLRDVNLQAQRLAPSLARMRSVEVFHTPRVPTDCRGIESSKYLSAVKGGQFLVGEFEQDQPTTAAVLIVNTSLTSSTSFAITPKEKRSISKVSSTTGQVIPFSAENNWLAPGQGMLLLLTREEQK
jgi:hypothetical protein